MKRKYWESQGNLLVRKCGNRVLVFLFGLSKERPYLVLALNLILNQISSFTHIYGFADFNGFWQIFGFNYGFQDFERPPCPQGSIVFILDLGHTWFSNLGTVIMVASVINQELIKQYHTDRGRHSCSFFCVGERNHVTSVFRNLDRNELASFSQFTILSQTS